MLRRPWIACLAWGAAALAIAGSARAAQIVFETVAAPAAQVGASCPEPCFNVRMFFEDPTRTLEIQAIQFNVAIGEGGTSASLPVPPESSNQAGNGNFGMDPWSLSTTVGRSPTPGFDALVVDAASAPFSVNSVQALFDAGCYGENCSFMGAALASNRIYLGRFNATLTGTDTAFRIGEILGNGAAIPQLRAFHNPDLIPEPPPPVVAPPAPLPAPPEVPPTLEEVILPEGPTPIWIPCDACLEIQICEGEDCAYRFYDRLLWNLSSHAGGAAHLVTLGVSEAGVPEPAAALLVILGAVLGALRRARR